MYNIFPIAALRDNYIWCIANQIDYSCIVVDPGEAEPVLNELRRKQLNLKAILITHHHGDHTNGISGILQQFQVPVFGPQKQLISHIDHPVHGKQFCEIDSWNRRFSVLSIPGHTLDHIAYYDQGILFCGDTLFTGGCGRIFEGTAAQLFTSLNLLADLPDETQIYCAHEYTLANLHFALAVEPNNKLLQLRFDKTVSARKQNLPTVPSTLALEKMTNPFLRCKNEDIIIAAQNYAQRELKSPLEVFTVIRDWKNNFIIS